ncbi:hypothetical protein K443DRAFT_616769 [Laccaria amethystina LaAM-08-1]|uniref:Uncharacterized protein n=1 Tax=Laccaria amethystina LaAM-08-1 TaxID=1095629 RepID=A0A0C9WPU8_9AGAR|nr:hypothetical protein K443DRAFT_616769 [Laccaria amethystina LaAM-08-1]
MLSLTSTPSDHLIVIAHLSRDLSPPVLLSQGVQPDSGTKHYYLLFAGTNPILRG